MIQNLWLITSNILAALALVTTIISFVGFAIIVVAFFRFSLGKEVRLFLNRRRPIMIFKSADQSMEMETKILKDSGLFTIKEDPTASHQNTDRIKDHGLIIVGYTKGMPGFSNILAAAKQHQIPIIVYASPSAITSEDFKLITDYSYHSVCGLPLRLVSDVFAILSTFPHEKK